MFCLAYSAQLQTVYLGAQNTSIQWCSLSRRDALPPDLSSHPSQRTHRFFDSKGPDGTSTPRPDLEPELEALGGEMIEISKANMITYAHFGYVYSMALVHGLSAASPQSETLISGGGDGLIKLWNLSDDEHGSVEEASTLESGDSSILSLALNRLLLYAGCLEGEVKVWDLESRQLVRVVKADESDILTVSIGRGITFVGAANGQCKAFERHRPRTEWKAHNGLVLTSAVTKFDNKTYLVTGGNDGRIAIWDLQNLSSTTPRGAIASNEQLVQALSRFVSYRTVSSMAQYAEDCRHGASWLRSLFKQFGATTEMLTGDTNGFNPVVFAHFRGKRANARRLLFYGHYDVVAAPEGPSKWSCNPFQMDGRNGYLYGRGVSDNKGPVLAAIYAVADLIKAQQLEIDVIFLIEGEEECGSRGFEDTVRKYKTTIGEISWILVANSYWLNDDFPCLTYGLRGALHFSIRIESHRDDLHSGVHGSSLVAEPLQDLVTLVASITGSQGRIQVPGFYKDIPKLTQAEEQWYTRISEVLQQKNTGHQDAEALKARWRQPTFTVHGFKTSGTGGNATIIPHCASVDISFRLVPNQDATKIQKSVMDFLNHQYEALGSSNELSISPAHPVEPWLGDPENELYQVLEEAVVEAWELGRINDTPGLREVTNRPLSGTQTVRSPRGKGKSAKASARVFSSRSENADFPTNADRDGNDLESARKPSKPLYIREGGSIPAIRFLEKEFDAPAAQLPCGQASDSAHLENERLRLLNLYNSRAIFRKVFRDIGLGDP